MIHVGWYNLRRDPLRAIVAIVGVTFSVVLITLETGLLSGLMSNASMLIDTSRADLWVSAPSIKTFDFATPFQTRARFRIAGVPGVEKVEEFGVSFSAWKLPCGANAHVEVVGINVRGDLAPRLNVVEGSLDVLHNLEAVFVDEGDLAKLGHPKIGDIVEIYNRRARVVGFTRGMKSFTTAPYIFTSHRTFPSYSLLGAEGRPIYLLIKLKPGADPQQVKAAIMSEVTGVDVYTPAELSWKTRRYWLVETGMGVGFFAAALLGLLVGGVIVSQSLYAMTVEKLPEFGVMRAMGASTRELASIVLEQGLLCGVGGLLLGLIISCTLASLATSAGTTIEVRPPLIVLIVVLTLLLCSAASVVSILRLRKVDPATIFRA